MFWDKDGWEFPCIVVQSSEATTVTLTMKVIQYNACTCGHLNVWCALTGMSGHCSLLPPCWPTAALRIRIRRETIPRINRYENMLLPATETTAKMSQVIHTFMQVKTLSREFKVCVFPKSQLWIAGPILRFKQMHLLGYIITDHEMTEGDAAYMQTPFWIHAYKYFWLVGVEINI